MKPRTFWSWVARSAIRDTMLWMYLRLKRWTNISDSDQCHIHNIKTLTSHFTLDCWRECLFFSVYYARHSNSKSPKKRRSSYKNSFIAGFWSFRVSDEKLVGRSIIFRHSKKKFGFGAPTHYWLNYWNNLW